MTEIARKPTAKQLTLDSILTFGEFKGRTIRDVADERPSYLVWAIKNIEWFEIDAAARKYGQRCLNQEAQDRINRADARAWYSRAWDNTDFCDNDMQ